MVIRKVIWVLISPLIVNGVGLAAVAAEPAESNAASGAAEPAPTAKELPYDIDEKRLDRAGEAIGK